MTRRGCKVLAPFLAIGALVLAGCGGGHGSGNSGSAAGGSYVWGINAELSGPLSLYGKSVAQGVQAYVDQANSTGGINGHRIELKQLDNAGDTARAATNATQLATADEVNAIFGYAQSSNCTAATPIAERYKVPSACMSVARPSSYVFSLGANNSLAGPAMLAAAKQVAGVGSPRAALVHATTVTASAMADEAQKRASASGVNMVVNEDSDITSTALSAPAARIVASRPDVVLVSHTGPALLALVKTVRAAGVTAPFVWLDGTGNLGAIAQATDSGIFPFTVFKHVDPATARGVAKDYAEAAGKVLGKSDGTTINSGQSVVGYATARAFGSALKDCGYPCSGPNLAAALTKTKADMSGLADDFSYNNAAHYPYANWYLYDVKGSGPPRLVSQYPWNQ